MLNELTDTSRANLIETLVNVLRRHGQAADAADLLEHPTNYVSEGDRVDAIEAGKWFTGAFESLWRTLEEKECITLEEHKAYDSIAQDVRFLIKRDTGYDCRVHI